MCDEYVFNNFIILPSNDDFPVLHNKSFMFHLEKINLRHTYKYVKINKLFLHTCILTFLESIHKVVYFFKRKLYTERSVWYVLLL